MAIIAMRAIMRSVNIAELKNRLSAYVTYAKAGEEVVIRDRNLPVAKLVPFFSDDASEGELALVAEGAMRLPQEPFDADVFLKMPQARLKRGASAVRALLDDREDSR